MDIVNKFTVGRSADIPIIISELCDVVEFLLDEIERIKSPPMTTLIAECPANPSGERGYQPKRHSSSPPIKPYIFPTTTCDEPLTEK